MAQAVFAQLEGEDLSIGWVLGRGLARVPSLLGVVFLLTLLIGGVATVLFFVVGLLAAMLLGALGVSHADIVADYALTVAGMVRFREWAAREWPEWTERMASIPPAYTAALPEAMSHILDELCDQHGTIRDYVRAIGVTDGTMTTLESVLLG